MTKNNGNALSEYALIIALIGVGLIAAFTTLGENITSLFADTLSSSNSISQIAIDQGAKIKALQSGSTPSTDSSTTTASPATPVKACNANNICDINFGAYKLTNIPANLSEFIETAGVSGGTESVVALIDQLAEQLQDNGLQDQSEALKELASNGHNIAAIENAYETEFNKCSSTPNPVICIQQLDRVGVTYYQDYDTTYTGISMNDDYSTAKNNLKIGEAAYAFKNDKVNYNYCLNTNNPAFHYHKTLQTILSDSKQPQEVKDLVTEMTYVIGHLGESFENNVQSFYNEVESVDYYDPITGVYENIRSPFGENDDIALIASTKAADVTNLDSALICATGGNQTTGTKCH